MMDISTAIDTQPSFADPDLKSVDLNVDIENSGAGSLSRPVNSLPPMPDHISTPPPSLSEASYEALNSIIQYNFNAPLIQNIPYGEYTEAVGVIDSAASVPPLDYPTADLEVPQDWENPGLVPKPELSVKPDPAWRDITFLEYAPVDFDLLELDMSELVYTPPDVREMDWREELVYDDDEEFRERLKSIMLKEDGEPRSWLLKTTADKMLELKLRDLRRETSKAINALFEDAAARNFSLPLGRVDAAAEELAEAENMNMYKAIQEIREEVYQAANEVFFTAVQQSFTIERQHFQLFLRYVRQNLQVYRLNLQVAEAAYKALAQIYQNVVQAINLEVEVYNTYIATQQAQNTAIGQQDTLLQAQTASFLARVQTYNARADVKRAAADVEGTDIKQRTLEIKAYGERLKIEIANISIIEQNLDAFRSAIKAHGDYFSWYEDALSAYESWLSAKSSASAFNESKVQAYSKLWGAEERRIGAFSDYVNGSISVMDEEIRRFREASRTQREYLGHVRDVASSSLDYLSAFTSAAREQQSYYRDFTSADISHQAATYSLGVAQAKVEMAQQAIDNEATAQYTRIDAAKQAATLAAAGALAQASSTIMQMSVGARGGVSESVQGQDSGGMATNVNRSKTWSKSCQSSYNYSQKAPT
jgi:Pyruvate/2-oxoacid:ferredoxin oxidoreductase gamma subunit